MSILIGVAGGTGSGKTSFARGFIRALDDPATEVPSPTFTLLQTYDTPRGAVWHFDLYRLGRPEDAIELGFESPSADPAAARQSASVASAG